jgi:hypothetical protein
MENSIHSGKKLNKFSKLKKKKKINQKTVQGNLILNLSGNVRYFSSFEILKAPILNEMAGQFFKLSNTGFVCS